jgi:eight-cysteine-cluster-containing protein
MMINKKDLKIGALAGITGFFLVFIFLYLTTGYLDWRFAAVIGIGCFGGGFWGSMLRRLSKAGEGRKATMITLIMVSFLIILAVVCLLIGMGIGLLSHHYSEDFCGWSTYGKCSSDSDCTAGGCSGQVCQSKYEEPVITTCEWKDCYDASKYSLKCRCIDGRCQWSK